MSLQSLVYRGQLSAKTVGHNCDRHIYGSPCLPARQWQASVFLVQIAGIRIQARKVEISPIARCRFPASYLIRESTDSTGPIWILFGPSCASGGAFYSAPVLHTTVETGMQNCPHKRGLQCSTVLCMAMCA